MCEVTYLRGGKNLPPRKTSGSRTFPFTDVKVPVILVQGDKIRVANSVSDKLMLLRQCRDEDTLLAAWPGRTRQDIFVVDEEDFWRMEQTLGRVAYNRG